MKIQMGDYISIEGLTVDQIRNAINKFEDAGFNPNHCEVPGIILKCPHLKWLGVDTESDIMALEILSLFGTERRCFDYDQLIDVSEQVSFIGVNSKGEGVTWKSGTGVGYELTGASEDAPLPLVVVDTVNHPSHYTQHPSGVECIEITRHMGFNLGNAIKYIWRADLKNDAIEDLKKAAFYINDEIEKRGGDK